MRLNQNKIASIHANWSVVAIFGFGFFYALSHWNDPTWANDIGYRGKQLPAPLSALICGGIAIYAGVGYTLYRDRIIMRLFGIPIWKFTWDQTCAAEYVAPKEKWQRPKVKFRIKPRNPGHPYRNLTVTIPERNADECMVALEECLGTIWMPKI